MTLRSYRIAALLFGSGLCALVYQVVWLRELRLVFGASTPATAAVLAVFMGGLGYGSLLLSKRADTVERPLVFYAHLELFIAAAAGVSKLLLLGVRHAYIALGGSVALGWAGGTAVRLVLTALVLLPATLAMGGTLPAAARAATSVGDETRRSTALLYGVNTIGAVVGASLSTFILLERLGSQGTLLVAVALNALVGLLARELDRTLKREERRAEAALPAPLPKVNVVDVEPRTESRGTLPSAEFVPAPARTSLTSTLRSPVKEAAPDTKPNDPLFATLASPGTATSDEAASGKAASDARDTDPALASTLPKRIPKIAIELLEVANKLEQRPTPSPLSRTLASPDDEPEEEEETKEPIAPFVLAAAAGVGFAFLTMELVWYRVLSPLLGGSSYTFGLILAVALAGIGIGGLLYTATGKHRPARLSTFALTCVLEALFIAVPFALGDRIAFLALALRDLGTLGLSGYLLGWTTIAAIVALPASIVAGYQFPLLIALLGTDRDDLGQHVGKAYAFNTLGAILGSLLGGFVLLPRLSALGTWRLSAWLLVILAASALWLHDQIDDRRGGLVLPTVLAIATLLCLHAAVGPTAVWRHTPIGAGRADDLIKGGTTNSVRAAFRERRRAISWMVDGRESSIGLYTLNDVSFMVNGKSDGAAVNDGGTQVMGGLIGALLRPAPVERAMVIGLGSGSTAGWLGELPSAVHVDVVELEPKMQQVARVCAPVNRDVLRNPKVSVIVGDAREVLLTTPERYDLVFSEPSNPYRAGVASLFTREFYEAVQSRLTEGGVFVQWLQAYEIDAKSLRMVYATLSSVFPSVETWRTKYSDLVLVSRNADVPVDIALLEARLRETPYEEALRNVWRVNTVEGVLSHFVARPALARDIAAQEGKPGINTDDRNALEFSIARALGRPQDFSVDDMLRVSYARGEHLPEVVNGSAEDLDEDAIYDAVMAAHITEGTSPHEPPHLPSTSARRSRYLALSAWHAGEHARGLTHWKKQDKPPESLVELMVVADLHAVAGERDEALPLLERLGAVMPVEAHAIRAKLLWAERDVAGAWLPLRTALLGYQANPWPNNHLMSSALAYVPDIARTQEKLRGEILEVLAGELAMFALHYYRVDLRLDIALLANRGDACVAALEEVGPHFPWDEAFLNKRLACFTLAGDPRVARAQADLDDFRSGTGIDFAADLRPTTEAAP